MDRKRARSSRDPAAAQRRLEILGAELAGDRSTIEGQDIGGQDIGGQDIGGQDIGGQDIGGGEIEGKAGDPATTETPTEGRPGGRHRRSGLAPRQRWSGELHDRLPGRLQSLLGRGLTAQHIVVVVAVVAAFACLTAWWVVSARPSQIAPLSAPSTARDQTSGGTPSPEVTPATDGPATGGPVTEGTATDGTATDGAATTPSGQVVVDVSGKVRKPGIVTLPAGSRVDDALHAAGGPRHGTKLNTVNLARVLVDGEQIVVGLPPVRGSGGSPRPTAGRTPAAPVNLNTATSEQLDTLPGIGPVTAQAILDWRAEHERFSSVDELLEVDGIGPATLSDLRDLVTV